MIPNLKLVAALDVGYSSTKVAFGHSPSSLQTLVLPSGAGPLSACAQPVLAIASDASGLESVDIGKRERYGVFLEPSGVNDARSLDPTYYRSHQYRALVAGVMQRIHNQTGQSEIEVLVTGLPVSQARDKEATDHLVDMITQTWRLDNGSKMKVNRTIVVAQPIGSFIEYAAGEGRPSAISMEVLLVDIGYFSTDYLPLLGQSVRWSASGTNTHAMSRVCEIAAQKLADRGLRSNADRIETAARMGVKALTIQGTQVLVPDLIQEAADEVAPLAFRDIEAKIRNLRQRPDVVLLTGGGANWYRNSCTNVFDPDCVAVVKDAATANVSGFWRIATRVSGHLD